MPDAPTAPVWFDRVHRLVMASMSAGVDPVVCGAYIRLTTPVVKWVMKPFSPIESSARPNGSAGRLGMVASLR